MNDERGDILGNWVVQLVLVISVLSFVGYEGFSIITANLSLDEDGRQVAAAARSAYGDNRQADDAIEAGIAAAQARDVEVTGVTEIGEPLELVFDLERTATTLVIHRVGLLEDLTVARASRRVPLAP